MINFKDRTVWNEKRLHDVIEFIKTNCKIELDSSIDIIGKSKPQARTVHRLIIKSLNNYTLGFVNYKNMISYVYRYIDIYKYNINKETY